MSIPRKILHVIPAVGPIYGGPSVMIRLLTQTLSAAGLEIHIATTDANGDERLPVPLETPVVEDGVTYRYFRCQTRFYKFSWPLTRWLRSHVRTFDAVHIHALFTYASLPAAYWAHSAGVPYLVRPLGTLNRWGMEKRRPHLKRISFAAVERPILNRAAAIHYTSRQEQVEAESWGIRARAAIIPNAVDSRLFEGATPDAFYTRFPQCRERLCLLFLSRLDPKKGLDLLLPAFAAFMKTYPQAMLVIAGAGEEAFETALKGRAASLGITSNIVWTGFIEGSEKAAAMAAADIFVLPSYSENFGIAAVEAMACGLPVLISDQVAVHHEITDTNAGLAVPCSMDAVTEGLLRLAADPQARAVMGANGRRLVQTRFSVSAVREQLLDVYASVIEGRQQEQIQGD